MGEYFEKQNSKDCIIHSLNNAFGRRVITKDEVLTYISETVKKYAADNGYDLNDRRVVDFRNKLSTNSTFFTADVVWKAAEKLGRIGPHVPIPGFGGVQTNVEDLPSIVKNNSSIVILGVSRHGPHAIAVRNGAIYDSQLHSKGPRPFTNKELAKSLNDVFVAFIMSEPGVAPLRIRRTQPALIN